MKRYDANAILSDTRHENMRHRMITGIGLGNPEPVILDNKGKLTPKVRKMMKEAFELWSQFYDGCDYMLHEDGVSFGREPAYQYERLFLIRIRENKEESYLIDGKAWGSYGSQIVSTTRHYYEYKYKSKFVRFIDKWHTELFRS